MRCHACGRFSFSLLCRSCQDLYLYPEPKTRRLDTGLEVLSFYAYDEIEPFLLTKHTPHGRTIYRILAKRAFSLLEAPTSPAWAVALDDHVRHGYSHTAVLAHLLQAKGYRYRPGTLIAANRVSYAGQTRAFRIMNPRRFTYRGPTDVTAIPVDDIVTSGLTLQEAQAVLLQNGIDVPYAVVLADTGRGLDE